MMVKLRKGRKGGEEVHVKRVFFGNPKWRIAFQSLLA